MRGFAASRSSIHVRATVVTYVADSIYAIRMDDAVIGLLLRRDRSFIAGARPRAGETLTARSACSGRSHPRTRPRREVLTRTVTRIPHHNRASTTESVVDAFVFWRY